MSKYDGLRAWKLRRARTKHLCDSCKKTINPAEQYWSEYVSRGVRVIGIDLGKLCSACHSFKQEKSEIGRANP